MPWHGRQGLLYVFCCVLVLFRIPSARSAWYDGIYSGTVNPRGWSYVTTNLTLVSGDSDDGWYKVPLPFNFNFLGGSYSSVFVGTNTYLTFGSGADDRLGLGSTTPSVPTLFVAGSENSCQRAGYRTDGSTYTWIRYEGSDGTSGTVGHSTIIFEALLTVNNYLELRVGPNARTNGLSGVSNGQGFLKKFTVSSSYTSLVFNSLASTQSVSNKTSSWMLDPFSNTPFPTTAPTTRSPTPRPTPAPSNMPTRRPTSAPSPAPTIRPTRAPSTVPTRSPTGLPTAAPTGPTVSPSTSPTAMPTVVPTTWPTATPSSRPTRLPTTTPTPAPTRRPSTAPTQRPSLNPTPRPSMRPTTPPTALPTTVPTPAPSQRPTKVPTALPTRTPTAPPTRRPTMVPTMAPTLPPHFGSAVVTSLNAQDSTSFAITSKAKRTNLTIEVSNVTSISIRALISGTTYTLLKLDVGDDSSSSARRQLASLSSDGKNLTLSLDTGALWWNAGLSKVQGSVHLEIANQLGQAIAYYDMYANVSYSNSFGVTTTFTNNSGLYEGTTLGVGIAYETTNRSLSAIDLSLGNATHDWLVLASFNLSSFTGSFAYALALDYDTLATALRFAEGEQVWVRVGYQGLKPSKLYRLTVGYYSIKSLSIDDPTCTYRGSCQVTWTSGNPYTKASLYVVNTDTGEASIYRQGGLVYSSQSAAALTAPTSLTGQSPGTLNFRAVYEQSGVFFGSFSLFLVCDDDTGSRLRYLSGPMTVVCPPLYYGTYCETKQSILNSMIVGSGLAVITFVWTCIVLWGDWLPRWSERIRYFVTERAVHAVRSFVGTVELHEKISDWGRATNPLQRDWEQWRKSKRKGKLDLGETEDFFDEGSDDGEEEEYEDEGEEGEGNADPNPDAEDGGGEGEQGEDGEAPPASRTQELDNTMGLALREAEAVAPHSTRCCPIRPHIMVKEAVTWAAAYLLMLFSLYCADIAMILANSYVLATSMARSANTPLDSFYDGVVITLNYQLPRFISWFPRLFSDLVKSFSALVQHLSFNVVFVQTFNVTCLGAQAPGQALVNVVLGSAIFLVFEMSFFEFIRVTFQGVSAAAPRYLRKEKPNASRLTALALPACAALLENLLKYSLQIFLSMFAIAPFITRTGYHEATQICDENFYNMDSWMAWVGTGLFWFSVLPIIHTVLNGLVPGVPDKHHLAASSLQARNRALRTLKEETRKLKGCCSWPRWLSNVATITASQMMNLAFGFSGKEGIDDPLARKTGAGGDEFTSDVCVLQQRLRCRPLGPLCWSYDDDEDEDDEKQDEKQQEGDQQRRRRAKHKSDENVLACTITVQIDRILRLTLLFLLFGFILAYVIASIVIRRAVIMGALDLPTCRNSGHTGAYCQEKYESDVAATRKAYSTYNLAYYAALISLPAAVIWVVCTAVYSWHGRECYKGSEFQNVQQLLPDCFLRCCGFLTYSEWKLHTRFRRRMQKLEAAMVGKRTRGFWSRSPTPNLTPTGTPRATIKSPRALKLWNKPLPRPWPSCLAVFQLVTKEHSEEVVWEDFEKAHAALEVLRNAPDRPEACGSDRLEQNFIYMLIEKCHRDTMYEATVKEIFVSVVSKDKGGKQGDAIRSGFSSADGEDLARTAFGLAETVDVENVRMGYKEFKHFCNILAPPLVMPSFFEVALLIVLDFFRAIVCWWRDDRQLLLLWKVIPYWWGRTARAYVIIFLWKLKQLVKLSLGWWDRETIEAFMVRERSDEFQDDARPLEQKEDKRFKDLEMMCALGQSRCLFWQLLPQTVIFSKLAEAINKSPLYIEDEAMTRKTAILKARRTDGRINYAVGPLVRQVAPFAPSGLLWFFPLEPQRALEALENSRLRRSGFRMMRETRLANFLASVALWFTTVLLTVVPTVLWIKLYFFITIPVRLVLCIEMVSDTLNINTAEIDKFVELLKKCCGKADAGLKVTPTDVVKPNEGWVDLVTPPLSPMAVEEPHSPRSPRSLSDAEPRPLSMSTQPLGSPVVNPLARRPTLTVVTGVEVGRTVEVPVASLSPQPFSAVKVFGTEDLEGLANFQGSEEAKAGGMLQPATTALPLPASNTAFPPQAEQPASEKALTIDQAGEVKGVEALQSEPGLMSSDAPARDVETAGALGSCPTGEAVVVGMTAAEPSQPPCEPLSQLEGPSELTVGEDPVEPAAEDERTGEGATVTAADRQAETDAPVAQEAAATEAQAGDVAASGQELGTVDAAPLEEKEPSAEAVADAPVTDQQEPELSAPPEAQATDQEPASGQSSDAAAAVDAAPVEQEPSAELVPDAQQPEDEQTAAGDVQATDKEPASEAVRSSSTEGDGEMSQADVPAAVQEPEGVEAAPVMASELENTVEASSVEQDLSTGLVAEAQGVSQLDEASSGLVNPQPGSLDAISDSSPLESADVVASAITVEADGTATAAVEEVGAVEAQAEEAGHLATATAADRQAETDAPVAQEAGATEAQAGDVAASGQELVGTVDAAPAEEKEPSAEAVADAPVTDQQEPELSAPPEAQATDQEPAPGQGSDAAAAVDAAPVEQEPSAELVPDAQQPEDEQTAAGDVPATNKEPAIEAVSSSSTEGDGETSQADVPAAAQEPEGVEAAPVMASELENTVEASSVEQDLSTGLVAEAQGVSQLDEAPSGTADPQPGSLDAISSSSPLESADVVASAITVEADGTATAAVEEVGAVEAQAEEAGQLATATAADRQAETDAPVAQEAGATEAQAGDVVASGQASELVGTVDAAPVEEQEPSTEAVADAPVSAQQEPELSAPPEAQATGQEPAPAETVSSSLPAPDAVVSDAVEEPKVDGPVATQEVEGIEAGTAAAPGQASELARPVVDAAPVVEQEPAPAEPVPSQPAEEEEASASTAPPPAGQQPSLEVISSTSSSSEAVQQQTDAVPEPVSSRAEVVEPAAPSSAEPVSNEAAATPLLASEVTQVEATQPAADIGSEPTEVEGLQGEPAVAPPAATTAEGKGPANAAAGSELLDTVPASTQEEAVGEQGGAEATPAGASSDAPVVDEQPPPQASEPEPPAQEPLGPSPFSFITSFFGAKASTPSPAPAPEQPPSLEADAPQTAEGQPVEPTSESEVPAPTDRSAEPEPASASDPPDAVQASTPPQQLAADMVSTSSSAADGTLQTPITAIQPQELEAPSDSSSSPPEVTTSAVQSSVAAVGPAGDAKASSAAKKKKKRDRKKKKKKGATVTSPTAADDEGSDDEDAAGDDPVLSGPQTDEGGSR